MKSDSSDALKMSNRNTLAFWIIVWLISVLTIGNLLLTITIFGVLRIGRGMDYLELVPERSAIKFFGPTDMDRILKTDGIIDGFYDIPVTITGERSDLSVNLVKTTNGHVHNKMLMSKNGTQFNGIAGFDLRDPSTNEVIFTTHRPAYNMPAGTSNLVAKAISTTGIRSAINDDLILNTTQHKKLTNKISIRGSEGVQLNGEELILDADNVELTTHNGSIVMTNSKGIYLNMKRIPLVPERSGIKIDEKQYKICVCMPEGRLFRVAMPTKSTVKDVCSYASLATDPCI